MSDNIINRVYDDNICSKAASAGREVLSYSLFDAETASYIKSTIEELSKLNRVHSKENDLNFGTYLSTKVPAEFKIEPQIFIAPDGQQSINYIINVPSRTINNPTKTFVLLAHYDSAEADCPGANDNGSGVAVLLAFLKLIAKKNTYFDFNLQIVFVGAEEAVKIKPGAERKNDLEVTTQDTRSINGSEAFFKKVRQDGKNIFGFINVDTVGFNPCNDRIYIHNEPRSQWLVEALRRSNQNNLMIDHDSHYKRTGDQIRGWKNDFMGIGIFQAAREYMTRVHPGSPSYHTDKDVPKQLNYIQMAKIVGLIFRAMLSLTSIAPKNKPAPFRPSIFQTQKPHESELVRKSKDGVILETKAKDGTTIRLAYKKDDRFNLSLEFLLSIIRVARNAHDKLLEAGIITPEIISALTGEDGEVNIFINYSEHGPSTYMPLRGGGYIPETKSDRNLGPLISLSGRAFFTILEDEGTTPELVLTHEYIHLAQNAYRDMYLKSNGLSDFTLRSISEIEYKSLNLNPEINGQLFVSRKEKGRRYFKWGITEKMAHQLLGNEKFSRLKTIRYAHTLGAAEPEWFSEGTAVFLSTLLLDPQLVLDQGIPTTFMGLLDSFYRDVSNKTSRVQDQYRFAILWYMIWRYGGGIKTFSLIFTEMEKYPQMDYREIRKSDFCPFLDNLPLLTNALKKAGSSYHSVAEVIWGNSTNPGVVDNLFIRDFTINGVNYGDGMLPININNYSIQKLPLNGNHETSLASLEYRVFQCDKTDRVSIVTDKKGQLKVKVFVVGAKNELIEKHDYYISDTILHLPPIKHGKKVFLVIGNMNEDKEAVSKFTFTIKRTH